MILLKYSQFEFFLIFMLIGFLANIPLGIINNLIKLKSNKYLFILFDIFSILTFTIIYLISTNTFCYGELRFFTLLSLTTGILLEKITIQKLFGFFIKKLYNIFVQIKQKFKNTKFFKFLSK